MPALANMIQSSARSDIAREMARLAAASASAEHTWDHKIARIAEIYDEAYGSGVASI